MYLVQTIYFSEISPGFSPKDLEIILATSRKNNAKNNLSGLLIFNGSFFMQALEGSRYELNSTLMNIIKDKRHKSICLMHHREIAERDFSGWDMAYVGQTKLNRDLLLRYTNEGEFKPNLMSGDSALLLLKALREAVEK